MYKATAQAVGAQLTDGWDGQLVGINAPGHLLLAPAADPRQFVIDPFVGELLVEEGALEAFVGARAPGVRAGDLRALVGGLLTRPMHRFDWTARSLRNLRRIYSSRYDYVRLLGAAERTLLVSDANLRDGQTSTAPAVPSSERLECEREVAMCLYLLGDEERAREARGLLMGSLRGHTWDSDLSSEKRQAWERLLEDDYFKL